MRPIPVVIAAVCVAGIAAHAQDTGKPAASGQTFRTATRLIQVSVVVHDRRNRPVEGLRVQDFELLEDGKAVPISLFDVHSSFSAIVDDDADGTYSNRVQSPSNGGVVAIIFDRLNTSLTDQAHARAHIVKYLGQVRPDDRIALYVLGPDGMRVLHDFTTDARSLLRSLARAQARNSEILAASEDQPPEHIGFGDSIDAQIDAFVNAGFQNMRAHFERARAYTSLEGLRDVAAHLAGVPGRKNLVWVSSGFPFTLAERQSGPRGTTQHAVLSRESREATNILNSSDIAVYPVDARGLVGVFSTSASVRAQQFTTLASVEKAIDGLRQVADWTGGRAFYNTNDIGAAISRAVEDSRMTYLLGYYPVNQTWDSNFRTIEVKVGHPGVEVRHRAGYFATPPNAAEPISGGQAILPVLDSPVEATAMPLSVQVRREADGRFLMAVKIEPGAISLTHANGRWTGRLHLVIAQTFSNGEHLSEADVTVPLSIPDAEHGEFLKRGLTISRTIALRPEAHQVRVVARDPASGTLGSVIIPSAEIR